MAANGYFQVVAEDGRMWLKIFAPEEGEVDISPEMVEIFRCYFVSGL